MKTTTVVCLIFIIFIGTGLINSQIKYLKNEVEYLSERPAIDGVLDHNLKFLLKRKLSLTSKSKSSNPNISVDYRIAYGIDFFYVHIEVDSNKLVFRDRAYQNGDGFDVILTLPKPDNQPTDEFYVLACSAVNKKRMEWSRKIFWYYNVYNIFRRTSKDTKMEFCEKNGKLGFELLLPWRDVHPYHPWISKGIGFNLFFVKGIGKNETNEYKVLDAAIGSENSKREYLQLKFQKPGHTGQSKTFFVLNKNHFFKKEKISGTAVTVSENSNEMSFVTDIFSRKNKSPGLEKFKFLCNPGITRQKIEMKIKSLSPGGYKLKWFTEDKNSKGETPFTSMPDFEKNKIIKEIKNLKGKISKSSLNTLKYKFEELKIKLAEKKDYETCGKEIVTISEIDDIIKKGSEKIDLIKRKSGMVRKAYRSDLDNKLLPYMIYIPKNYDLKKKYPLLVFLHGSASTEMVLLGRKRLIPDDFIAVAPNGRGTSNCYSWDNAQDDISEVIDVVCENYSIDKNNVILSGFSMGGYGVYRTYFENNHKFKGLAIFSGHPNLANKWSDSDQDNFPDFSNMKYLKRFKGIPMFIFHGEKDLNCSFETTKQIINNLKKAGAKVEFYSEKDKGHERAGKKTMEAYHQWIERLISQK